MESSNTPYSKLDVSNLDVDQIDQLDSAALENALSSVIRNDSGSSMDHKDHNSHSNTVPD